MNRTQPFIAQHFNLQLAADKSQMIVQVVAHEENFSVFENDNSN